VGHSVCKSTFGGVSTRFMNVASDLHCLKMFFTFDLKVRLHVIGSTPAV